MKTVVISPFSRALRSGATNAKDYPWWKSVVQRLRAKGVKTVQIGLEKEESIDADERYACQSLAQVRALVETADTWASVDNFVNHWASFHGKRGVVIFSKSDPDIFGYEENLNLLKSRSFLRPDQFGVWDGVSSDLSSFVEPQIVADAILSVLGVR